MSLLCVPQASSHIGRGLLPRRALPSLGSCEVVGSGCSAGAPQTDGRHRWSQTDRGGGWVGARRPCRSRCCTHDAGPRGPPGWSPQATGPPHWVVTLVCVMGWRGRCGDDDGAVNPVCPSALRARVGSEDDLSAHAGAGPRLGARHLMVHSPTKHPESHGGLRAHAGALLAVCPVVAVALGALGVPLLYQADALGDGTF